MQEINEIDPDLLPGEGKRGWGTPNFKWPSDRDDRMGAKIKTQKNPLGFKQNRQKIPAPKFNPPKNPMPNFWTIKIFQKALNDITRK